MKSVSLTCASLNVHSECYFSNMPNINFYTGETLVFGNDTGVCLRGDAILSHDDVANNWINVC